MGIDIGGTFTDLALVDDATGGITVDKLLTTPHDPSMAVLEGFDRLVARCGLHPRDVTTIVHGSTLVTNAVIERRGATTGLLVTRGFRDVPDIALERRYDLYDLRLRFPEPMVPRALRREITERMQDDGTVLVAPDLREVDAAIDDLVHGHQVRALAIGFLHSFTNPAHEAVVAARVLARHPGLAVSTSADVAPSMREYERWTTAALNAFVQPMVAEYLARIEDGLGRRGFRGTFHVMSSSGGTLTAATARRYPVRMLESGPAAGVLMAAHHGRALGLADLLSFDMGGTTAKGAIVQGGAPQRRYELEVARVHEFKAGSGLPIRVPAVDLIEIGAGGGGIAAIDGRGVIRVGPQSAGANPGPACYARGGDQPTLTDANLLLGYYDPRYFLGGQMPLDAVAAQRALALRVATPLRTDPVHAAWGIHETINEDVARAFRVHASELGFDYRACTMVAYGGAGPAHALRIARKLRVPRVIFPAGAGVMSAIGMLVSPLSFEVVRSNRVPLASLTPTRFARIFDALCDDAMTVLADAGAARDRVRVERRLDMRYQGQGYEIEIALPEAIDTEQLFDRLPALFAAAYARIFAVSHIDEPLEIVQWKVEARAPEPAAERSLHPVLSKRTDTARKGVRPAWFPEAGGRIDCPVFDRHALRSGTIITGPALIEEPEATTVVGVGDVVTVDAAANLLATLRDDTP